MKIAHIVLKTIPYGGGIEKYVQEIGPRLVKKGHQITVYTMSGYGSRPGTYGGMRMVPISILKGKSFEKMSASIFATLYECFKGDAEIVHYHAFAHQMPFLVRWFGKKVLVQGHGIEWKRSRFNLLGKAVLRELEALAMLSAHRLTVVSQVQKDYLRQTYGKDSVYIPTGVNRPKRRAPRLIREKYGLRGDDYLLFTGRLVPEKGLHTLIKAYQSLKPKMKLVLAGESEQEKKYKTRLEKLTQGNPNILFTGNLSGVLFEEMLTNPYLYILPSELEGLSTALLEALSYGNAALVSDIPENREGLGKHGFTFKDKDPVDLERQLKRLIAQPQLIQSKRKNAARQVLQQYSWDSIAEQFHQLYLSMGTESRPKG